MQPIPMINVAVSSSNGVGYAFRFRFHDSSRRERRRPYGLPSSAARAGLPGTAGQAWKCRSDLFRHASAIDIGR